MRTFDLIDCHFVEAVSSGRMIVTNQSGLTHALRLLISVRDVIEVRGARACDLIIELGIACSDTEAWTVPSGRIDAAAGDASSCD
jgi:hypothetical protein